MLLDTQIWYNTSYIHINYNAFRYPDLLPFSSQSNINKLETEFLQYQLMDRKEIPDDIWKAALVVEDSEAEVCYYRMDVIWNYMKSIQDPNGIFCFQMLSHIALLVLTLPHSNAAEERVFSLINN